MQTAHAQPKIASRNVADFALPPERVALASCQCSTDRSLTLAASTRRRAGVTLVEILIVMIIVAILAAFLLPAIAGARRTAQQARIRTEIDLMAQALEQFKTRHGVYPPSRICLHENPDPMAGGTAYGDHGGDAVLEAIDERTLRYLARIWPDFDPNDPTSVGLNYFDYNGNGGGAEQYLELNGSECLVFSLGGMPLPMVDAGGGSENLLAIVGGTFQNVTTRGVSGFSRDPLLPFGRSVLTGTPDDAITVGATQRFESLFEFPASRLSDVDLDGFWEFYDPAQSAFDPGGATFDPSTMPHPYAYFSGYDGEGYNFVTDTGGTLYLTVDSSWRDTPGDPASDRFGLGWPVSRNASATLSLVQWLKPSSFQIISPGLDGLIGTGAAAANGVDETVNSDLDDMIFDGADADGVSDNAAEGVVVINPDASPPIYTLTDEMGDDLTNFTTNTLESEKP